MTRKSFHCHRGLPSKHRFVWDISASEDRNLAKCIQQRQWHVEVAAGKATVYSLWVFQNAAAAKPDSKWRHQIPILVQSPTKTQLMTRYDRLAPLVFCHSRPERESYFDGTVTIWNWVKHDKSYCWCLFFPWICGTLMLQVPPLIEISFYKL